MGLGLADANEHPLSALQPEHAYFIGIDSDGCAFDTMEIKHKECFIPNTIRHWGLQPVARCARETHEFVNLYSRWRGINRFPALVQVFDLMRRRPEVGRRAVLIPIAARIREFIDSGLPLSNTGLAEHCARSPDPELRRALDWSDAVNRSIADIVRGVPPFAHVRESLEAIRGLADVVVVSATPGEALAREWREHGIDVYVRGIVGQEYGSKTEHLQAASAGKYVPDHVLMIGDAPGDLEAARVNRALFYPVNPGREEESWERFRREALPRFLGGSYRGSYERSLVDEFEALLPATPPWEMLQDQPSGGVTPRLEAAARRARGGRRSG